MDTPKRFSVPIPVRFSDLDAYGHVNNATFITYLETARVELFREPFVRLGKDGYLLIVANVSCTYKKPITLEDAVVVDLWFENIGRTSFTIMYEVNDGAGTAYAEASTVIVCLDAKTMKPTRPPEYFFEGTLT